MNLFSQLKEYFIFLVKISYCSADFSLPLVLGAAGTMRRVAKLLLI
jgi:hypothetical protein